MACMCRLRRVVFRKPIFKKFHRRPTKLFFLRVCSPSRVSRKACHVIVPFFCVAAVYICVTPLLKGFFGLLSKSNLCCLEEKEKGFSWQIFARPHVHRDLSDVGLGKEKSLSLFFYVLHFCVGAVWARGISSFLLFLLRVDLSSYPFFLLEEGAVSLSLGPSFVAFMDVVALSIFCGPGNGLDWVVKFFSVSFLSTIFCGRRLECSTKK